MGFLKTGHRRLLFPLFAILFLTSVYCFSKMTSGCITLAIPHVLPILSIVVDPRWDKSGGDFCCLKGLFCVVGFSPLALM